jgi:hypothetical protein
MDEFEAVYNVQLTKEQLAAMKEKFRNAVQVADNFGGGDYNVGILFAEREDDFVEWCEQNGIDAKLV